MKPVTLKSVQERDRLRLVLTFASGRRTKEIDNEDFDDLDGSTGGLDRRGR